MTEHIKINDAPPRVEYLGDGSTRMFPAPFPFLASADVRVWIGNNPLVEEADYSITGAGETSGGTVTIFVAPADNENVVIYRSAEIERMSDFLPGGSLRADTLNDEFDRLTLSLQECKARLERSVRLSDHDHGIAPDPLPTANERASRVLAFDADGHPIAGPETSALADIDSAVTTAASSAVAAASSASTAAENAALVGDVAALVQNIPVVSTATGDGTTLTFALGQEPVDAKALMVSLDGVLQHLTRFSVSGSVINFTTAPADGTLIEVRDLSSTAIVNAADVSSLAAVAGAIATVDAISTDVSAVAGNADDITVVADDLNGANQIAGAIISASNAAGSAMAASSSESNAGASAASAAASATQAEVARSAAENAGSVAQSAQVSSETAQLGAEDAKASAEFAATAAAASAAAAITNAANAITGLAGAVGAAARAGFRARFGKTPPAVLPFYLGDVSALALTRPSGGTAINEQGGPESFAVDTARIEHDPDTSERLGLLLEPAATNLIKHSADQSHPDWTTNAGYFTRTPGQADPAGGFTATRLRCDIAGTTAANYLRQFTATSTFTSGKVSLWVRRVAGTGNVKILGLNGYTGISLNITSYLTADWQQFWHSGTAGGGYLYFGIGLEALNDEVDVAFFQCEGDVSGEIGSFIQTTSSPATRAADVATVDLSGMAGFRPAAFTMLAEVIPNGNDGVILDIGSGAISEVALELQSGNLKVTGANGLDITTAPGQSAGDRIVVALRFQTDSVAVSVNGAPVVMEGSHHVNGTANRLQLGANVNGSNPISCVIQQVAFFGPLPDTDLEAMSNA